MSTDVLWDEAAKLANLISTCETGGDKVSLVCRVLGQRDKRISELEAELARLKSKEVSAVEALLACVKEKDDMIGVELKCGSQYFQYPPPVGEFCPILHFIFALHKAVKALRAAEKAGRKP